MRDSSKFSARRKKSGNISNARRGTNPIELRRTRHAGSQPRGLLDDGVIDLIERRCGEIGQIHRHLRAIARRKIAAHRLDEWKSAGRFANLARDRAARRPRSCVARLMLNAIRNSRAPTIAAPAVGWAATSPISGGLPSKPAPADSFQPPARRACAPPLRKNKPGTPKRRQISAPGAMRDVDAIGPSWRRRAERTESRPPRRRADARLDAGSDRSARPRVPRREWRLPARLPAAPRTSPRCDYDRRSDSQPSRRTPGALPIAPTITRTLSASLPSEKFGTHSITAVTMIGIAQAAAQTEDVGPRAVESRTRLAHRRATMDRQLAALR